MTKEQFKELSAKLVDTMSVLQALTQSYTEYVSKTTGADQKKLMEQINHQASLIRENARN